MKKVRILAMFIAVVMVVSIMPAVSLPVFAATAATEILEGLMEDVVVDSTEELAKMIRTGTGSAAHTSAANGLLTITSSTNNGADTGTLLPEDSRLENFVTGNAVHYKAKTTGNATGFAYDAPVFNLYFKTDSVAHTLTLLINADNKLVRRTATGWGAITNNGVDFTEEFEIIAVNNGASTEKDGQLEFTVWATNDSNQGFINMGTAVTSGASSYRNNQVEIKSKYKNDVIVDFVKTYVQRAETENADTVLAGLEETLSLDTTAEFNGAGLTLGTGVTVSGNAVVFPTGTSNVDARLPFASFSVGNAVRFKMTGIEGTPSSTTSDSVAILIYIDEPGTKTLLSVPFVNNRIRVGGVYPTTSVDFTEAFEIIILRTGTGTYEVWASQNGTDFENLGEATAGTRTDAYTINRFQVRVGNSQKMDIDAITIYIQEENALANSKDFNDIIGKHINNGDAKIAISLDSANELNAALGTGDLSLNNGGAISGSSIVLPAVTGSKPDARLTYSSFPIGSVVHYKSNGFTGTPADKDSNTKVDDVSLLLYITEAEGAKVLLQIAFYDNKPKVGGVSPTTSVDFTKPFEVLISRVGERDFEVWVKGTGAFFEKLGTFTCSNRTDKYTVNYFGIRTGNNIGTVVDFMKLYTPTEKGKAITVTLTEDTKVNEAGTTLTVDGTVHVGNYMKEFSENAYAHAFAYDNDYGYTTYIGNKDYEISKEADTELDYTFDDLQGAPASSIGLVIWDENGRALTDAWGKKLANTATGKPETGVEAGFTVAGKFNDVYISGWVGVNKKTTVAVAVKDSLGNIVALGQTETSEEGMFETVLGVDPYNCNSGEYTVSIVTDITDETAIAVALTCDDAFDEYDIISAETLAAFVNEFGTDEEKEVIAANALTVYAKYLEYVGEGDVNEYFNLSRNVPKAVKHMVNELAVVRLMNAASANKRWGEMQKLIMTTYSEHLGITADDRANVTKISNKGQTKELFLRLEDMTFTSSSDIVGKFRTAITDQLAAPPSGGGGGGGGGAAKEEITNGEEIEKWVEPGVTPEQFEQSEKPISKETFKDLEGVEWAKESIINLNSKGIISGDGSGNFAPYRNITREEFVKLVLGAFNINTTSQTDHKFADVDKDAWYSQYVNKAYECGIVTGMSETKFGIGSKITRADMATILVRALKYNNVKIDYINNAIVFKDVWDIPDYAMESVNNMYRAGFLTGKAEGVFAPLDTATRAEAAVALDRVVRYIEEQ